MGKYDNTGQDDLVRLANNGDGEAAYELGWRSIGKEDIDNAVHWFKKAINIPNNPRRMVATDALAGIYSRNNNPYTNKNEAIRLLETIRDIPIAAIPRLNLGFLYCEQSRTKEGLGLIEGSIKQLIAEDGDDSYLKQIECYKIGVAYEGAQCFVLSTKYYEKAIERCNTSYASDQMLIQKAKEGIESNKRRLSMGLQDMGKNRVDY